MTAQPNSIPQDCMWHEYSAATTAYLNLQLDLYMAVASEDGAREATLNDLLILAGERRRCAREAIRVSEQQEAASSSPAADSV